MFEHLDAGKSRHILKNPKYPDYRVTYDGWIATVAPDEPCVGILDVSFDPPKQIGGMNSRLNGWTDDVPDEFYHEALMALRELQAKL